MRRKWIFLGIIAGFVAFGIYAFLTGGLTFERIEDFGAQRDIRLVAGLQSDIALMGRTTEFSYPLFFHYYREEIPFSIFLQIWDDEKKYVAIEVSRIHLQYADGESVLQEVSWSRELRPYTKVNSFSGNVIRTEMMQLGDEIKDVVKRHLDVKITLFGNLVKVSGERVGFQASGSFKAESRTQWGTGWEAIAGC